MRPAILFAAVFTFAACDTALPLLPTAPSEFASGVVLYEHANYAGDSAHVTSDVPDLRDFSGPCAHNTSDNEDEYYDWNDCISSLRVAAGWRAALYERPNYQGESYTTTRDTGNLQLVRGPCSHDGLNDCVSSVRVIRLP